MILGRAGAWFALCVLAVMPIAHGHAISTNYLFVTENDANRIAATWDIAAADLHWSLDLDPDRDGRVLWSEILAQRNRIGELAIGHLDLHRGDSECSLQLRNLMLARHTGEPHVSLQLEAQCPRGGDLGISSTLFFDQDAAQKTLLDVTTSGGHFTTVLSASGERWTAPERSSWRATLAEFIGQGLWHVWIGYDHIAFLLLLLLPSVLHRTPLGWCAAPSGRRAAHDLLIIVTAFTIAHSITLTVAATGTARPPVQLIEAAIAFSIVVAGALNLFPGAARWRLALAFGFGLMHGFGFANALAELGALGSRLLPALAGFNIGVELAQLSIVLLVFPWLLRTRASPFYAARLMPATSIAVAVAGAVWLTQRL